MAFVGSLPDNHPLRVFVSLVNTAVGDAITGILMVEYVLAAASADSNEGGLCIDSSSLPQWFSKTYTDLASRQIKVVVADRTVIETTDMDRRVTKPELLQVSYASTGITIHV